jgi:predicted aspartyl protease
METATVGKVIVSAKIENLVDLEDVHSGRLGLDQVRRIELDDALVDTGASTISMPKRLIDQLGLRLLGMRQARTANGMATFGKYSTVRLTVQGRDCALDVAEVADGCPVLIGVIALEMLDFVVDPKNQRLIGNPEHGGVEMFEMY